MSLNLTLIANHSISLTSGELDIQETIERLNSLKLDNDFIYNFQKKWFENRANISINKSKEVKWKVNQHTVIHNEIGIMFSGDYQLRISICQNTLQIANHYRYIILEKLKLTEDLNFFIKWRAIWHQIITKLGGNQLLYLHENDCPVLEAHWDNKTFEEIIDICKKRVGEVIPTADLTKNKYSSSIRFLEKID